MESNAVVSGMDEHCRHVLMKSSKSIEPGAPIEISYSFTKGDDELFTCHGFCDGILNRTSLTAKLYFFTPNFLLFLDQNFCFLHHFFTQIFYTNFLHQLFYTIFLHQNFTPKRRLQSQLQ